VLSNCCRNLLAKKDCRAALVNESHKGGCEVSLVKLSELLSGNAERLARWAAGPEWCFVADSGELQREGPPTDSGEEVALGEAFKVFWLYFCDASVIN